MIRVAVLGAGGRMGREVCRAVAGDNDLELVAAVDPQLSEPGLVSLLAEESKTVQVVGSIADLEPTDVDAVVDFTVAESALSNLRWCAAKGVHAVVGTSGLGLDARSELERLYADSQGNCIIAANFAIGAVLMMRLAELCAPYVDGVEIVEMHHDGKVDAPSGTAVSTAERLLSARSRSGLHSWDGDRTSIHVMEGSRGASVDDSVRIHSVRLPGLVAHQQVIMTALGQCLTITHDAFDRTSFMPGVLLALKSVSQLDGLTIGLDRLLDF